MGCEWRLPWLFFGSEREEEEDDVDVDELLEEESFGVESLRRMTSAACSNKEDPFLFCPPARFEEEVRVEDEKEADAVRIPVWEPSPLPKGEAVEMSLDGGVTAVGEETARSTVGTTGGRERRRSVAASIEDGKEEEGVGVVAAGGPPPPSCGPISAGGTVGQGKASDGRPLLSAVRPSAADGRGRSSCPPGEVVGT